MLRALLEKRRWECALLGKRSRHFLDHVCGLDLCKQAGMSSRKKLNHISMDVNMELMDETVHDITSNTYDNEK